MSKVLKSYVSEIKSVDEKEMTLTAYVSTGARDRHNESVDPEGLNMSHYRKNPVVLWAHDYSKAPIGKAIWIKNDGQGIIAKVKFANTEAGKEAFELYQGGFMRAFSIGFMPDAKHMEEGDGEKKPRMTYRKSELLEFSAVPVPANPEALALALQKGLKTDFIKQGLESYVAPEDMCEEVEVQKESADEPVEIAKDGFEELIAENTLLKQQLSAAEGECAEVKFKLYQTLTIYQNKQSEITVENLSAKVEEIVNGVIRKAQGKVD